VLFSYSVRVLDGKEIGVIRIPVQQRPVFLTKDFGKLKANVVYLRRGSSTVVARPDEVAEMGKASGEIYPARPVLLVGFGDPVTRSNLGLAIKIEVCNLTPPSDQEIPDYAFGGPWRVAMNALANKDYYREYAAYLTDDRGLMPIWFYAENAGEVVANDVRLEGQLDDAERLFTLRDATRMRQRPRKETFPYIPTGFTASALSVEQTPDGWIIHGSFGKLQPKQVLVARSCLFVGARHTGMATLDVKMFADNLTSPKREEMSVHVLATHRALSFQDLCDLADASGDE
jgi:hypothetical protein